MSEPGYQEEETGGGMGAMIAQLPSILWQRRWFVIVPAALGLIVSTVTAFVLPTQYESSAVMIVQSPSLPDDVIGSGTNELIDRRIEAIRQQIVNRPALLAMIEQNQLYTDERGSKPLSTVIETMRDAITLVPEKIDLGGARQQDNTISVRLAYLYEDPAKAQAVAQALMERVVEVNSTSNTEQAVQTVAFLTEQQSQVQNQIAELEGQISALNVRYGGVLASGGSVVTGGSSSAFDMQIASLERENAMLRSQRETLATADTRDPAVVAAEAQLAGARAIYSDSHPDVQLARRRLAEAQQFARNNVAKLPTENIDTQIAVNERQIIQLRSAKAGDAAQMAAVLAERARAPGVQQQAAQLQQRLSGLYEQFEGISQRLLAARAGARADQEQMGERLLVVDPPVVPDKPTSPNRPLIIGIGFAAGLGLGLILALAVEMFLHPVRDPKTIKAITGARPLAMVPVITPLRPRHRGRGGWRRFLPFRRKAKLAPQVDHG
jgi:polysaccharide biosynthesis transport protein